MHILMHDLDHIKFILVTINYSFHLTKSFEFNVYFPHFHGISLCSSNQFVCFYLISTGKTSTRSLHICLQIAVAQSAIRNYLSNEESRRQVN